MTDDLQGSRGYVEADQASVGEMLTHHIPEFTTGAVDLHWKQNHFAVFALVAIRIVVLVAVLQ